MRRIRRPFALGAAGCALALIVTASPAIADTPAMTARSAAPTRTAASTGGDDGALRAAMLATLDAGATSMIARVDDGDGVTQVGVGLARLEPPHQIKTTDQVRVGSITKSMVATVTLQLVGEGRLHLSDTIEEWLPGLVPNGDNITLQMLLNHTSGIFDYTDDPDYLPTLIADPYRYWSPRELVEIATAHPPVFPPGTSWSYSNTGYILIGMVLEKATGTPIQTLLNRRVIKPLHLNNTFFATTGRFRGSYAHGYVPPGLVGNDDYIDVSNWSPSSAWAAGAVVSNADDLAHFYTALMSGQLLTPALLAQMTTTVAVGEGFGYGLGIYTMTTPCGQVWGHDGGIAGYVSFAFTDEHGSRSSVVLLPTQPDDAIGNAGEQVLAIAVCMMFGAPVAATTTRLHLSATG